MFCISILLHVILTVNDAFSYQPRWPARLTSQDVALESPPTPGEQKIEDLDYYGVRDDGKPLYDNDLDEVEAYKPDVENKYQLYTRLNLLFSQPLIYKNATSVKNSHYSPSRPTAVLIHGWKGNGQSHLYSVIVKAYLTAADVNVITVDWGAGADTLYVHAVANTVTSGESVASFIKWLNSVTGSGLGSYHIAGHSLGAHQAGVVGRSLGGAVPYITGLDPAGPGWLINPNRLKSTDALYTEVIHTNGGELGYKAQLGHTDFYPNKGHKMPGCDDTSCHHARSYLYFAESLATGGFEATRCNSYDEALRGACHSSIKLKMGGPKPKMGQSGVYYLETNTDPPYSKDITLA